MVQARKEHGFQPAAHESAADVRLSQKAKELVQKFLPEILEIVSDSSSESETQKRAELKKFIGELVRRVGVKDADTEWTKRVYAALAEETAPVERYNPHGAALIYEQIGQAQKAFVLLNRSVSSKSKRNMIRAAEKESEKLAVTHAAGELSRTNPDAAAHLYEKIGHHGKAELLRKKKRALEHAAERRQEKKREEAKQIVFKNLQRLPVVYRRYLEKDTSESNLDTHVCLGFLETFFPKLSPQDQYGAWLELCAWATTITESLQQRATPSEEKLPDIEEQSFEDRITNLIIGYTPPEQDHDAGDAPVETL